MHEMSIAQNLLDIIKQEMAKHNMTKLYKVHVKYGKLTTIVPEALSFSFEVLLKETPLDGAELIMKEIPLTVRCFECKKEFTPGEDSTSMYMPCPHCGEEFGHEVITGKELFIDSLEAE